MKRFLKITLMVLFCLFFILSISYMGYQDWKEKVYSKNSGCLGNNCGFKMKVFWTLFDLEKQINNLFGGDSHEDYCEEARIKIENTECNEEKN